MHRLSRALLIGLLGLCSVTVALVGVGARVAPMLGFDLLVIRGGSMEPVLSIGDLVVVEHGRRPAAGDVAAYRLPSGTTVTHRVVRPVDHPSGPHFETRGDANAASDPALVPAGAVVGTLAVSLPLLGFVLALLAMPSGVVAIACIVGALWIAVEISADAPGARRSRPEVRRRIESRSGPVVPSTPTR